ncbi:MAG: hypothetical protein H6907_06665 [Hyphomicrobiales bacterium]|nr:hypothetical protein [Hyphomicrobiales bacterium]
MTWIIFMVGLVPLLAAYYPLKGALPPLAFVAVAVVYVVLLRLAADALAAAIRRRRDSGRGRE